MSNVERPQPASGGYSRQLNNFIQATKGEHTLTWEEYSNGPLHQIVWSVMCRIDGIPFGAAIDFKKNIARDQAARIALISLGVLPPPSEMEQIFNSPDSLPYAYFPSYTIPGQPPSYPPC